MLAENHKLLKTSLKSGTTEVVIEQPWSRVQCVIGSVGQEADEIIMKP